MQRLFSKILSILLSLFLFNSSITATNNISDLDLSKFGAKLSGTLDNRDVTMYLSIENGKIKGIYQYGENKIYLTLEGNVNENGNCLLFERISNGKITGKLEGVITENEFSGVWEKSDKTKACDFKLFKVNGVLLPAKPIDVEKIKEPEIEKKDYSLIYIGGGILMMIFLLVIYNKLRPKLLPIDVSNNVESPKKEESPNYSTKSNENKELSNFEKGKVFEDFVINKFDSKYFTQLHRTSDSMVNGISPLSNQDPDFVYEFKHKEYVKQFAVECKFKGKKTEVVTIDKVEKINRYRNYSSEKKLEVYIVIGLGGSPHNPSELFIVPLEEINNCDVDYDTLKKYCRSNVNNFFYDPTKHKLS